MSDHKTEQELAEILNQARTAVTVGARYQHFRGAEYIVQDIAILEATNEAAVIYRAEYGEHLIFIRPLSSWLEMVEQDGKRVPRFAQIT